MTPDKIQQAYAARRAAEADKAERSKKEDDYKKTLRSGDLIQRAIIESARLSIEHRDGHEPKVEVKNFPKVATQEDMNALNDAVAELGITSYINHTESVEAMTDAICELINNLNKLPDNLKTDGFNMLAKKLDSLPKPLDTVSVDNLDLLKPYFDGLQESLDKIDIKPQVNVDVPKADPVDFSPIVEALNKEEPEEVELTDFMVEDQVTEGTMQYFGLVHPKGMWTIIENNKEDGTWKYAFGQEGYNFNNRGKLSYGSVTGINELHS